jgi:hypothetical protein
MAEIKLIDYDFAKYGSAAERKRLHERVAHQRSHPCCMRPMAAFSRVVMMV